jgi:hypothetical protein
VKQTCYVIESIEYSAFSNKIKKGEERKKREKWPAAFPEAVQQLYCSQHTGNCVGAELDHPWLLCAIKRYFKGRHRIQFSLILSLLLFSKEKERQREREREKERKILKF